MKYIVCYKCINNNGENNYQSDEYPNCEVCGEGHCILCTTRDNTECKDFKERETNG